MSTSVGVMEGNIEEKWPLVVFCIVSITFLFLLPSINSFLFMGLEELADQEFDASDIPPNLEDRAVLFCVGKIERVNRSRAYMLLPNYTCRNEKKKRERNCDGKQESMSHFQLKTGLKINMPLVVIYLCVCWFG